MYFIFLTPNQLGRLYYKIYGVQLGPFLIQRELRHLGYKYRKLRKSLAIGQYEDRDKQFETIFDIILRTECGTPVLSIDCKKKEYLGNFYRDGQCFCSDYINVFDHDYSYLALGRIIPFGIYDIALNQGYISIGSSAETAYFIKDNLLWWWDNFGIHLYADANTIILLCDCGGGNSYRHHAFKKALQELAAEIGLDIIVCHYPPYASKWNPIEHRLFCHVHQAMQGIVFSSYEVVQKAIENTSTKTGLSVKVRLNLKTYQTGIKTTKEQVDEKRIQFHKSIPKLNYRILA